MQLRLHVEYEGHAFVGWQAQPNGLAVQDALERALTTALREPTRVRGAGRTDAGVHACGQVATAAVSRVPEDLDRLQRSLNALTPPELAVRSIDVVDDAFDPRRHAKSRRYEYRIWNAPAPSPFWRRYAWHLPRLLALDAMAAAAQVLEGEHDFAAFEGADPAPARTTVRRVFESRLTVEAPLVTYRIEATAFLKHMVRNIVGTLVEIGLGVRPAASMAAVLAGRDRTAAGATAPPHGLVLVTVRY
ncbi:MAG: tRNA pseudouridine(38-40) synthase TruA [Candidatus Binatia bacterium]